MRLACRALALIAAATLPLGACARPTPSIMPTAAVPPAPPPSPSVVALALGDARCAVLADGSTACWPPLEGAFLPVLAGPKPLGEVIDLAVGDGHACARLRDGAVACWSGAGSELQAERVSALPKASGIAAGARYTCAIVEDATVRCWGENDRGQIDAGALDRRPVFEVSLAGSAAGGADALAPQRVPEGRRVLGLGPIHSLQSRGAMVCALLDDETVRCQRGSRGVNEAWRKRLDHPVAIRGLTGVRSLALGAAHGCALLADRTVSCWGSDEQGQLGRSASEGPHAPERVPGLGEVAEIAAGSSHSCARLLDGSVRCWGDGSAGQLGAREARGLLISVPLPGPATSLVAGPATTCADVAGGFVCWGGVRLTPWNAADPVGPRIFSGELRRP